MTMTKMEENALKSFYDANKWRYPRARYDYYKNNGYKLYDWFKGLFK